MDNTLFGNITLFQLLTLCLFVATVPVRAQTSDFEKWKQSEQQAFRDFQTKEDKAFIQFLEDEWEAFTVFKGEVRDITPKPAKPPEIRHSALAAVTANSPFKSIKRRQPPSEPTGFYGHSVTPIDLPAKQLPDLSAPTHKKLAATWSLLSSKDHSAVLAALRQYRQGLALGDWGLIKLTDHLLKPTITELNQRIAYSWFLLNRLDYDVRVGYTEATVHLLLPTTTEVYGKKYSVIDTKKYYMLPAGASGKLFSYDGQFKPNLADLDFTLVKLIKPSQQLNSLEIELASPIDRAPLLLVYDAGLSGYLSAYPQIDLRWYFTVQPGNPTAESLVAQLRPLVAGMNKRAAINYLLHFTQNLFSYQTDDEQFGTEKYLLIEESLHYRVNDCEDRSIFLAWLLTTLLDVDLIALDYPGHVALAVSTTITPKDSIIIHQGRKYVVADPTYIGADLGMAMPGIEGITPKILPVAY